MSNNTVARKILTLDDLVEGGRPICYGVLKPGDFIADGIPLVRIVDLVNDQIAQDSLHRISRFLDAEFRRSRLLGGEVLVSIQGTIGRVAVVPEMLSGANISRTIARIAVNQSVLAGFLSQWLRSPYGQRALADSVLGTTRDSLNIGVLRRVSLPVPPISEQRRIVKILDTADEVIRSTELLIAKLERAKRGLLHDLLTYGIDDNDCLRSFSDEGFQPSSLGLIPPGWQVTELSNLGQQGRPVLRTGPFGSSLKGDDWTQSGVPVITIGSLGEGFLDYSELLFISQRKAAALDAYRVEEGEIVFSRVADVGRSVVIRREHNGWVMSSNLMKITLEPRISHPDYVQLALAYDPRVRRRLRATINSSGRDVVSDSILRSLLIPLPPVTEQLRISAKVSRIQTLIEIEAETLAKHRSLKQGLMDDLLTGQVQIGKAI
jgi:type I restriction enzyme, S subunit